MSSFSDKSRQALSLASSMKQKAAKISSGGVCHACGGVVGDDLTPDESTEPQHLSDGGEVDDYEPESTSDTDVDTNSLEFSPEVSSGEVDNGKDEDNEAKRSGFLRAYMISRKTRG